MSSTSGTPGAVTPRSIRRAHSSFRHGPLFNAPVRRGVFLCPDHASTGQDAIAASVARTSSAGRTGFCRQTTLEISGDSTRKSRAIMPDIATIGKPGTRLRILLMTSSPLVPCRKMSTIATSNEDPSNWSSPASAVPTPQPQNDGSAARWISSSARRADRRSREHGAMSYSRNYSARLQRSAEWERKRKNAVTPNNTSSLLAVTGRDRPTASNFTKLHWKPYSGGVHCRQLASASALADTGKYVTLS
jgi:hypothetical protein